MRIFFAMLGWSKKKKRCTDAANNCMWSGIGRSSYDCKQTVGIQSGDWYSGMNDRNQGYPSWKKHQLIKLTTVEFYEWANLHIHGFSSQRINKTRKCKEWRQKIKTICVQNFDASADSRLLLFVCRRYQCHFVCASYGIFAFIAAVLYIILLCLP